jgi:hypothetical protein
MDEYLPEETLQWCHCQLQNVGYDLSTLDGTETELDGSRRHRNTYMQLRLLVHAHIRSGMQPILLETPPPRNKAYEYYQEQNGALARLFQENREAFIQSSGEIEALQVPLPPLVDVDLFQGLEQENLDE